jgi:hypothetical protein
MYYIFYNIYPKKSKLSTCRLDSLLISYNLVLQKSLKHIRLQNPTSIN